MGDFIVEDCCYKPICGGITMKFELVCGAVNAFGNGGQCPLYHRSALGFRRDLFQVARPSVASETRSYSRHGVNCAAINDVCLPMHVDSGHHKGNNDLYSLQGFPRLTQVVTCGTSIARAGA